MSSSTSSSRAIFGKIFLACVLGMGMALVLVRLFAEANDAKAETILERVMQARAALPKIVAEPDPVVMVFGSSMVDAGFSARQFDRQMAERGIAVKSFNFGFGGLNPYFQDYLARRIRDEFVKEGRQLDLAVLEFNPFQTTKARWNGALPIVDGYVSMLATPREMWELTLKDPTRGIRVFNIHYLRNDISAEMITWFFGRGLQQNDRPRSELPRDEALEERRGELGDKLGEYFDQDYPDYTGEDWYYPWQGAGTIPEERSEEMRATLAEFYELGRNPRRMENDRLNRIYCCDIIDMEFEEELIQAYIRIVKTFQEFSKHIDIVMLPRNTDWIEYPPEARQRLDVVLQRIEDETGLAVTDMQDLDVITPEMFSDTTHLGRYSGDVAYTEYLVEQYAPLFPRTRAVASEPEPPVERAVE